MSASCWSPTSWTRAFRCPGSPSPITSGRRGEPRPAAAPRRPIGCGRPRGGRDNGPCACLPSSSPPSLAAPTAPDAPSAAKDGAARAVPARDVRLLDGPFRDDAAARARYLLSLDPDRLLHTFRLNAGLPTTAQAVRRLGGARGRAARPQPRPLPDGLRARVGSHGRRAAQGARRWRSSRELRRVQRALAARGVNPGLPVRLPGGVLRSRRERARASGRPTTRCTRSWRGCWTSTASSATRRRSRPRRAWPPGCGVRAAASRRAVAGDAADRVRRHGGVAHRALRGDQRPGAPAAGTPLRPPRRLRSARARRGPARRAAREHPDPQGDRGRARLRDDRRAALLPRGRDLLARGRARTAPMRSAATARTSTSSRSPTSRATSASPPPRPATPTTCSSSRAQLFLRDADARADRLLRARALQPHPRLERPRHRHASPTTCPLKPGRLAHLLDGRGLVLVLRGHRNGEPRRASAKRSTRTTSDALYVNLFVASELAWREKGLTLRQETRFPERGQDAPRAAARRARAASRSELRHPAWAGDGFAVSVNGRPQPVDSRPGSYAALEREWRDGDVVELRAADAPARGADAGRRVRRWRSCTGPSCSPPTSATLGSTRRSATARGPRVARGRVAARSPTLVAATASEALAHLRPTGEPLTFRSEGPGRPSDVVLRPFYRLYDRRHAVYLRVEPEAALAARDGARAAGGGEQRAARGADRRRRRGRAAQAEETGARAPGRARRRVVARGPQLPQHALRRLVELRAARARGGPAPRCGSPTGAARRAGTSFEVTAEGETLATQSLFDDRPGELYAVEYPLPERLTRGRERVRVGFRTGPTQSTGRSSTCGGWSRPAGSLQRDSGPRHANEARRLAAPRPPEGRPAAPGPHEPARPEGSPPSENWIS